MLCCFFNKKPKKSEELGALFKKLRDFYRYEELDEARKELVSGLIEEHGYLPYTHIKALEELSDAEVIFGIEKKLEKAGIYKNGVFEFKDEDVSPLVRSGQKDSSWITKEQHDIKLINLAGLGNGNQTQEAGKFIDWLRQLLILPVKKSMGTTIYLIPFHPREFGCAYLPMSSGISPNIVDRELKSKLQMDEKQQIQSFVTIAQLASHPVIYDVLPQTGRFSKMVLAKPHIARWYNINLLSMEIEKLIEAAAEKIEKEFDKEDVDIVKNLLKSTLRAGSCDLSEYYKEISEKFQAEILKEMQKLSFEMTKKHNQQKLHKRVSEIVAAAHGIKPGKKLEEEDITNQSKAIQTLIEEGLWPAPGGAWCSSGVPVFEKMSECGSYPMFKHFDHKGQDVTHFANLDCQTPYYFVNLENGEFNGEVVDFYIEFLKNLQKEYNFDGFRIDHLDHVVDEVSEKDGKPISYRAPRYVLNRLNKALKSQRPHFATIAEYMLGGKHYKEYHEDMGFDLLWGDDISSQYLKTPEEIVENNQELSRYNRKTSSKTPLSIIKTYNNQDGEFRAINQYPSQLSEKGAIFKWLKYKLLPGGKYAQRPVMYIDGDESFTKKGIEGVICAEVSMPRNNNEDFFQKFDAINRFAHENELTAEGEAEIILQEEDGFVIWMITKDPLKECFLVAANYLPPTQKIMQKDEFGVMKPVEITAEPIAGKSIELPCDYKILSEIKFKKNSGGKYEFVEEPLAIENKLSFEKLDPSEFRIFKLRK